MTRKETLENKLKLWDNPAFIAFIEDLQNLEDNPVDIEIAARMLKLSYRVDLKEIEERQSKYKQGNLGL